MNYQDVTIRIPAVIDRRITPNGRAHWRTKHNLQKELKQTTMWAMKGHHLDVLPETPWQLNYVIGLAKGRRRLDDDNAKAALKYVQDGIAAEAGIDDKHIIVGTVEFVRDPQGVGFIDATIKGGAK